MNRPCRAGGMLLVVASATHGQTFVNWESPHVSPLDLTPDGSRLLAVNTADNRLEVFTVTGGGLAAFGSVPVGLDPVSVRARSNTEAWVVNHVSDTISVSADATQIQQVLMNLVLNAIEAMTEHGTPDKRLRICSARHGAVAVDITVQDSGPGLTGPMLDEVFEPFYTTKDQGLGMGLAICRSIIAAVDGQLWASSDGAAGSTFHIRLPAGTSEPLDVG